MEEAPITLLSFQGDPQYLVQVKLFYRVKILKINDSQIQVLIKNGNKNGKSL